MGTALRLRRSAPARRPLSGRLGAAACLVMVIGALLATACGDDDSGGKKDDCRRCEVDADCVSGSCEELTCINLSKVSVCLPADFDPSTDNAALICNPDDLC